jgi:hypothetical protein
MLAERLAATGLDRKKVGERVVDAIRTKTFYAFVSAVPADVIKARHRRIEDAPNSPWGNALLRLPGTNPEPLPSAETRAKIRLRSQLRGRTAHRTLAEPFVQFRPTSAPDDMCTAIATAFF